MDDTPNLELPFIMPAQAQKHVTHNEALLKLDAIVQLSVKERSLSTPPDAPADGDRYIVGEGGQADWAGHDSEVAAFQDGAWSFYPPNEGWLAWIDDEDVLVAWNGNSWIAAATSSNDGGAGSNGGSFTTTPMLGINATADDTNRLSTRSAATLLNHEGSGHQLKINKANEADTASLLYQTGFSGRAEMGLAGNDDFSIKVSVDGSAWKEAIVVDSASGRISFPQGSDAAEVLGSSQPFEFTIASGGLWGRPDDRSLNAVNWRHIVNQNPFEDGSGVGGENYANEVTAIGWNLSDIVGVPAVPGEASLFDTFEFKFNIAGQYHAERHMEMIDTGGTRRRYFSFAVPHDGGAGSSHLAAIDHITWKTFDSAKTPVQWNLENGQAFLGDDTNGFQLNFDKNGVAPVRQRNSADDAYIDLPYIDSEDRLINTGRQQNNVGPLGTDETGVFYPWNPNSIANGAKLFEIAASDQVNSEYYAFYAEGGANWRIKFGIRNYHASGYALGEVIASGPAFFRAHDYANNWSFGKDANGDFFLGNGDPGSNTVLEVDKARLAATFHRPPQLPSYSIGELPEPSTYGAGSLVFVSNEAGGAVTAFSDGTNWRRTTDRQIVS